MQFTTEQIMPAPIERVETMYWDPEFAPRKYRELGLKDVAVVSQNKDARQFQISCNFKMKPSLEVPKPVQRFVGSGDWLDVTQTDRWDMQTRKGRLDIVIHAFKTVTIYCEMSLEPHAKGAVNRMTWHVDCSVPLVGGAIAKFLAQDIQRKFEDDVAAAVRILKTY